MKKNLIINDWLEVRLTTKSPIWLISTERIEINADLVLVPLKESRGTGKTPTNYTYHYEVLYMGIPFAYLNALHVNRLVDVNSVRLIVNNTSFYHHLFPNFCKAIFRNEFMTVNNIIRIDIAYDTTDNIQEKAQKIFSTLLTDEKPNGRLRFWKKTKGGMTCRTESWGTLYEMRQIAHIYNKSNELKKSNKKYIQQYYDTNGLKGMVYRMELRLNYEKLYKSLNLKIDAAMLGDASYLYSILNTIVEKRLTFIDATKSNCTRAKKHRFISKVNTDCTVEKLEKVKLPLEQNYFSVNSVNTTIYLSERYPIMNEIIADLKCESAVFKNIMLMNKGFDRNVIARRLGLQ